MEVGAHPSLHCLILPRFIYCWVDSFPAVRWQSPVSVPQPPSDFLLRNQGSLSTRIWGPFMDMQVIKIMKGQRRRDRQKRRWEDTPEWIGMDFASTTRAIEDVFKTIEERDCYVFYCVSMTLQGYLPFMSRI